MIAFNITFLNVQIKSHNLLAIECFYLKNLSRKRMLYKTQSCEDNCNVIPNTTICHLNITLTPIKFRKYISINLNLRDLVHIIKIMLGMLTVNDFELLWINFKYFNNRKDQIVKHIYVVTHL